MLLYEFDADPSAVINPSDLVQPIEGFPEIMVSCFAKETFDRLKEEHTTEIIESIDFANLKNPVYKITLEGVDIGLVNAYVGAAGCVSMFDYLIACGMKKLIIFGTCGVLDKHIEDASIIVPTDALRDEGASFHYAPPSEEIEVNVGYFDSLIEYLNTHNVSHTIGKVWTTDAFYRETRNKMQRRKDAGCICVDMECSALAALAQFRGIDIVHFFYSADNLDTECWDIRSLENNEKLDEKHKIGELALGFAVHIANDD
ncbi:phosphorylase [Erysipelothrix larvae]|uniref:Uridine phosphorylase n=1 Tax=Erysipelothrix larvae TaxID=1514105 RepID=A0A0X8H1K6_9FIRM|nr:nucleoside phosphorylase [Erysipelothrix larvae]AMC94376.1 phosphorylase [Erysipelothrix larvae]